LRKERNRHYPDGRSQAKKENPAIPLAPERKVIAGPIFKQTETGHSPELVDVLASVLVKMALSPASKLERVIDLDRQYRMVKEDTWVWSVLPMNFTLTFAEMPPTSTKNFFLLYPLGSGLNGRAWLASPEKGKACVVKFPRAADRQAVDAEVARWNDVYGPDTARVILLNKVPAIVMPFVKTCTGGVDTQDEETKNLAKDAVEHMVSKGRRHNDLGWRHVGLCMGGSTKKAVLIDLGNVSQMPVGDPSAKAAMLGALGLNE